MQYLKITQIRLYQLPKPTGNNSLSRSMEMAAGDRLKRDTSLGGGRGIGSRENRNRCGMNASGK